VATWRMRFERGFVLQRKDNFWDSMKKIRGIVPSKGKRKVLHFGFQKGGQFRGGVRELFTCAGGKKKKQRNIGSIKNHCSRGQESETPSSRAWEKEKGGEHRQESRGETQTGGAPPNAQKKRPGIKKKKKKKKKTLPQPKGQEWLPASLLGGRGTRFFRVPGEERVVDGQEARHYGKKKKKDHGPDSVENAPMDQEAKCCFSKKVGAGLTRRGPAKPGPNRLPTHCRIRAYEGKKKEERRMEQPAAADKKRNAAFQARNIRPGEASGGKKKEKGKSAR